MNNNKQTAVGFLENAIHKYIAYVEGSHKAEPFTITQLSEAVEQAKEMEKKQKKKDFEKGYECGVGDYIDCENGFDCKSIGFEEYYIKEYGNETTEKLE